MKYKRGQHPNSKKHLWLKFNWGNIEKSWDDYYVRKEDELENDTQKEDKNISGFQK